MKPLYLSIENINSFKEKQEVDFKALSENRIFCISGTTGSGKTTILDCIIIALFAPRNHNRGTLKEYITIGQKRGEIIFRFLLDGNEYEVKRILKENSSGGELLNLTSGEKIADQPEKVTAAIEDMLKITHEDFRRVVVLEQGQFSKFLSATNAERIQSVTNLFHLKRFDKLKELFADKYKECDATCSRLDQEINELQHVNSAAEKELNTQEKEQRAHLKKTEKLLTEHEKKRVGLSEMRALFERKIKAELAVKELTDTVLSLKTTKDNLIRQNDEVLLLKTQLEQARMKEVKAREVLLKIEQAIRDNELINQKEKEREKAREEYKKVSGQCNALLSEEQQYLKAKDNENAQVQQCIAALNNFLKVEIAAQEEQLIALREKIDARQRQNAEHRARLTQLKKEQEQLTDSKNAAMNVIMQSQLHLTENEKKMAQLKEQKDKWTEELNAMRQKNAAMTVAGGLKNGDACPVCGGVYHGKSNSETLHLKEWEDNLVQLEEQLEKRREYEQTVKSTLYEHTAKVHAASERLTVTEEEYAKLIAAKEGATDDWEGLEKKCGLIPLALASLKKAADYDKSRQDVRLKLATMEEKAKNVESEGKRLTAEIDAMKSAETQTLGGDLNQLKSEANEQIALSQNLSRKYEQLRESYVSNNEKFVALNAAKEQALNAARAEADSLKAVTFDEYAFTKVMEEKAKGEEERSALLANISDLAQKGENMRDLLKKKNALVKERTEQNKRLSCLIKMKKCFDKDAFLSYLGEEYIYGFTEAAGVILSTLTEGKYSLEYDKEGFFVRDFLNENKRRKVKTLSGGETFLAAMSMAIAISREISAERNYEFFFLDEGFGTLHDKAIETVTEALKKLAEDTVVGVVSHRSELTEKIACKLLVTAATEDCGATLTTVID